VLPKKEKQTYEPKLDLSVCETRHGEEVELGVVSVGAEEQQFHLTCGRGIGWRHIRIRSEIDVDNELLVGAPKHGKSEVTATVELGIANYHVCNSSRKHHSVS